MASVASGVNSRKKQAAYTDPKTVENCRLPQLLAGPGHGEGLAPAFIQKNESLKNAF